MSVFPSIFDPTDVAKEPYLARTQQFAEEGANAGYSPASRDKDRRVALIIVDAQNDFVLPTGALSVPGAVDDTARLVEWIYRNTGELTAIFASLDSHVPNQIFFSGWWKDPNTGQHPAPYTAITADDIQQGRWTAAMDPVWSHGTYVPQLKANAQKDLMIWPYHTMIGQVGQALVSALSEAISFHSAARHAQPTYLTKGTVPQVEHYGIFAPEVEYSRHPQGSLNVAMLDMIGRYDLIYIAGQAKSHCVLETMGQMMRYFGNQPDIIRKFRFLMDCTSSVQVPGVDFDGMANAALAQWAQQGMELVNSTDPIG